MLAIVTLINVVGSGHIKFKLWTGSHSIGCAAAAIQRMRPQGLRLNDET
jgi:hypothetical protein